MIAVNVGYNTESGAKSEVTFQSDDDTFNSLINSASSYCAYPIYRCNCHTTTSLTRSFFSSITSNLILSLLISTKSIHNGFPSLRGTSRDMGRVSATSDSRGDLRVPGNRFPPQRGHQFGIKHVHGFNT